MNRLLKIFMASALLILAGQSYADAPLKSKLGLSVDQAKQVQTIQKSFRRKFSAKRQALHKERRKLRRARTSNDSAVIAQQEQITAELQRELQQIRQREDDQIRGVLTPEQTTKFEDVIRQRQAAVGSSRDARELK